VVALGLPALVVMAVSVAVLLLLLGYRATLGQFITLLVDIMNKASFNLPVIGRVNLLFFAVYPLQAFNNTMYYVLGKALDFNQWAWNRFMHVSAYTWDEVTGSTADHAVAVNSAVNTLVNGKFPALMANAIKAAEGTLSRPVANTTAPTTATTAPKVITEKIITQRIIREQPVTITKVEKLAAAGVLPRPLAFPNPWPRVKEIEKGADALGKRITNLAKKFTVAGIVGLVGASIFHEFNLNWLRCSGVRRLGNLACGLGGLIEELLGAALVAMAWGDVCTILSAAVGFVEDAQPVFDFIATEFDNFLGCQGANVPPALTVVQETLPPVTAYAALPAVG
jgi:hypothetical protein